MALVGVADDALEEDDRAARGREHEVAQTDGIEGIGGHEEVRILTPPSPRGRGFRSATRDRLDERHLVAVVELLVLVEDVLLVDGNGEDLEVGLQRWLRLDDASAEVGEGDRVALKRLFEVTAGELLETGEETHFHTHVASIGRPWASIHRGGASTERLASQRVVRRALRQAQGSLTTSE
ncbi:MAG: hypothetical protein U0360_10430 [Dehalococcoidia bacterium]